MNKFFILILIVLMSAGCSGKWERNRTDAEDFSLSHDNCRMKSQQFFPVKNEVAQETRYDSHVSKCGKSSDCNGENYKVSERPVVESYVIDVNEKSRKELYTSCMKDAGWEKHIF